MMNGVLMSHGIDAISVPAARAHEFNEKMVRFYLSNRCQRDDGLPCELPPGAQLSMQRPEDEDDYSYTSGMQP